MKHRGEHRMKWGEGRLIAAALALILVLSFAASLLGAPRKLRVEPVHEIAYIEVEQAGKLDINAASAKQLEELPGIGAELAQRIVAYREENGAFAAVEELMNVDGIGEGKFEQMRDLIFAGEMKGDG